MSYDADAEILHARLSLRHKQNKYITLPYAVRTADKAKTRSDAMNLAPTTKYVRPKLSSAIHSNSTHQTRSQAVDRIADRK